MEELPSLPIIGWKLAVPRAVILPIIRLSGNPTDRNRPVASADSTL